MLTSFAAIMQRLKNFFKRFLLELFTPVFYNASVKIFTVYGFETMESLPKYFPVSFYCLRSSENKKHLSIAGSAFFVLY